jgi:hypothetical protein
MRHTIGKACGGAMAILCVVSTLALAQGQTMVCTKGDDRGNCIEAKGPDGKIGVVKGEGVKVGETMTCITAPGGDLTCTKVPVKQ